MYVHFRGQNQNAKRMDFLFTIFSVFGDLRLSPAIPNNV